MAYVLNSINKVVSGMIPGQAPQPRPDFSSGLCSCCEDFSTCCCGMFCQGYLLCKHRLHMQGRTEEQMECWEKTCGVILSIAGLYWVGALGIAIWETCIRNEFRKSVNIVENPGFCEGARSFFCYPCAICQQERELNWLKANSPTPVAVKSMGF